MFVHNRHAGTDVAKFKISTLNNLYNKLFLKRALLIIALLLYFYFFILDILKINASFLSEASSGEYGWERSPEEYFFGNKGFLVLDGLIMLVAFSIILTSLFSRKKSASDLFALLFSLFLFLGFIYFGLQEGLSKYQTWKYFSFMFIFFLLFLFKRVFDTISRHFRILSDFEVFFKFFLGLFVVWLVFFFSQPTFRLQAEQSANPSLAAVSLRGIDKVANLDFLETSNVAIYLGSVGETMLISSLMPSESVLILSGSYYGKPSPKVLDQVDFIFTRFDLVQSARVCSSLVLKQISMEYFLYERNSTNSLCFSRFLEKLAG
jgi:hypothetical protein